jgi:hypothetical protein
MPRTCGSYQSPELRAGGVSTGNFLGFRELHPRSWVDMLP